MAIVENHHWMTLVLAWFDGHRFNAIQKRRFQPRSKVNFDRINIILLEQLDGFGLGDPGTISICKVWQSRKFQLWNAVALLFAQHHIGCISYISQCQIYRSQRRQISLCKFESFQSNCLGLAKFQSQSLFEFDNWPTIINNVLRSAAESARFWFYSSRIRGFTGSRNFGWIRFWHGVER